MPEMCVCVCEREKEREKGRENRKTGLGKTLSDRVKKPDNLFSKGPPGLECVCEGGLATGMGRGCMSECV